MLFVCQFYLYHCASYTFFFVRFSVVTLTGIIVGFAVCIDVLIQYSSDYGIESTYTTPPLSIQPDPYAGTITITLTAYAPTSMVPCTIIDINNRGNIQTTWKLIQRDSSVQHNISYDPSIASSNYESYSICKFMLTTNDYLLTIPYYDSITSSNRLGDTSSTFTLGYGLQILEWDIKINDAKDETFTKIVPYDTIKQTYNGIQIPLNIGKNMNTSTLATNPIISTTQRAHILGLRMYTSKYTDRSFYDSVGETIRYGYRATALQYQIEDSTGTVGANRINIPSSLLFRGDTFAIMYSRTDLTVSTIKIPRFSILALLGIIFGLGIGTALIFKIFYLYCEIGCHCSRIQKKKKDINTSSVTRWWENITFHRNNKTNPSNNILSSQPSIQPENEIITEHTNTMNTNWEAVTAAAVQGALKAPPLSPNSPITNQITAGSTVTHLHGKPPPAPPKIGKFREPSLRLVAYTPANTVQNMKNILKRGFSTRSPSILSSTPPPPPVLSSTTATTTVENINTSSILSSSIDNKNNNKILTSHPIPLTNNPSKVSQVNIIHIDDDEQLPNTNNPFFGHSTTTTNKMVK